VGSRPQDDSFLEREVWDLENTPPDKFPLLLHFHPLVIYRHQVLEQADVAMAMFLLGNEFTTDQKRRNFDHYDPLTTGDSSLSASIQSIVASELGDERRAARYFDHALMALVFGYGGVRNFDAHLTIDPHLPEHVKRLAFSLRFHDRQIRVTLTHLSEHYELVEGDPLDVTIHGKPHQLEPGVAVELTP
jgi:alpha,alpha-trehalose phosphorylase